MYCVLHVLRLLHMLRVACTACVTLIHMLRGLLTTEWRVIALLFDRGAVLLPRHQRARLRADEWRRVGLPTYHLVGDVVFGAAHAAGTAPARRPREMACMHTEYSVCVRHRQWRWCTGMCTC